MNHHPHRTKVGNQTRQRGSALLVVLVFLVAVVGFLMANGRVLNTLNQELRRVEEKQEKKFSPVRLLPAPPQPQK
jgi:Tfp pilus assembly protein PilX